MKTWKQNPWLTMWIVKRTTVTEWLHLKPVQPSGGAIFSLHPSFGKPGPKTISHPPFITFSLSSSDSSPISVVAAENPGHFNCSTWSLMIENKGDTTILDDKDRKALKVEYSRTSRKRPPKMQRLSGRLRPYGRNHGGPLPRKGPGTSTLGKIIYWMQFLSDAMCCSMLLLKFFVYSNK